MTLIVYDTSGKIVSVITSESISSENNYAVITADVPEDKFVKSVNPQTKEVELGNVAKTDYESRLSAIEAQMNALIGVESEETA